MMTAALVGIYLGGVLTGVSLVFLFAALCLSSRYDPYRGRKDE